MPGRKWTESEIEYLKENYLIKEHIEIAKDLNRSAPGVSFKCSELKLTKLHKWTKTETDIIERLYKTVQYQEIGKLINRTKNSISQYVNNFLEHYDTSDKRRKYATNDGYFKKWSHSMAYILGYATADGCLIKNRDSTDYYGLQFYLNKKDKEFLEFFVKEISPEHHICESGDFVCVRITSKTIVEDLRKLGVTERKTGKEVFPDVPKEFFWDYIRGLLDGDGWVYNGETQFTVGICSANKSFLDSIARLTNVGTIHKGGSIYRWDVRRISDVINMFPLLYHGNCPFKLSRKYEKYSSLVEKLLKKEPRFLSGSKLI